MNENGGELSGKYCSKLGTNVMVLKTVTDKGEEQRRCLSSHLCHADGEKPCDMAVYEKEKKNNQNTFL